MIRLSLGRGGRLHERHHRSRLPLSALVLLLALAPAAAHAQRPTRTPVPTEPFTPTETAKPTRTPVNPLATATRTSPGTPTRTRPVGGPTATPTKTVFLTPTQTPIRPTATRTRPVGNPTATFTVPAGSTPTATETFESFPTSTATRTRPVIVGTATRTPFGVSTPTPRPKTNTPRPGGTSTPTRVSSVKSTRTPKPTSTPRNFGPLAVDFRASAEFDAGAAPSSVATADFNGDGHQDAAIVSRSANTLTILLGQGVKVFTPGPDAPDTGREPVGILAVDLDCNGEVDLVTCEATDFTVSTYFNDGRANFSVGQRFDLGGEPSALTIYDGACPSDAEPQGRPWRLAVADRHNSRVVLLRFDGSGLTYESEAPTGLEPIDIAAGDVDHDGRIDLLTADDVGASVSILYANDGGFSAPRRIDLGGSIPGALAVVDFDVDGLLDFGVTLPLENRIAVYHQGTDTTFQRVFEDDVPARPSAIAMPDDQSVPFTGDHFPDLLVLSDESALLSVYRGKDPSRNPPAPFELLTQYTLGKGSSGFALSEFDRDASVIDLVVVNRDGESAQAIRGRAGGSFFAPVSTQTDLGPSAVVVGDFDGDSNGDTVTANLNGSSVSFLKGNGAGSVRKRIDSPVGTAPTFMVSAEFTGDSALDLVLASNFTQEAGLYPGHGDGTFGFAHPLFLAGVPSALVTGDIDQNGAVDVAVSYEDQNLVDVFTDVRNSNNPGLTLTATGPTFDVALGDVNGDGTVDVVALVPSLQQLNVWYQSQAGSFDLPMVTFSTQDQPTHFVLTDLNGDGQLDAVVASYNTSTLGVMLARNGGFRDPTLLGLPDQPVALYAGDFNLDGAPDITVLSDISGRMTFLAGAGNGTFPENRITHFAAGTQPQSFGVGQLNNDISRGVILPDIAVADYAEDRVAILRNNTDVPAGNPSPAPTSTPRVVASSGGGGGCDLPERGDGTALLLLAAAAALAVGRGYWGGRRA